MKIIPIISNDNTYQPRIYEQILKARSHDIPAMIIVPFSTKKKPFAETFLFMCHLYGIKGFFIKSFQVIRNKILDLFSSYIPFKKSYSLEALAQKYNIPVIYCENLNASSFLEQLRSFEPDIILSSQGHYIGKKLLKLPRIGIINKHASILPKYRGIYPVFWALFNNETETGVTIHFMNENIDDGDIIIQEIFPINEHDTFESIYEHVIQLTPKLFLEALTLLESGKLKLKENNSDDATYFSYPTIEDIKEFKRLGKKII